MRFQAQGPDIPDELLWARDEGRVVFVCGAGVSLAEAKLPDFQTLADRVLTQLLVSDENKAKRILELAMRPENEGLVPVDKVFGELEKHYDVADIEEAIDEALKVDDATPTRCHEIIRDIATGPNGAVRLVTTNFDDLFSRVVDTQEWVCPDLPRFERGDGFSGLVYLHGKASDEPIKKRGRYVLSTRSFGLAYMAEGWASTFLKHLLQKYSVVFVGYSADDPPMQYLLEALAISGNNHRKAYAFHRGDPETAKAKWEHRGVEAIAFEDYEALWSTLGLWAERARDSQAWISKTLDMASSGPFELADWQRSQIAHLASHPMGAKAISQGDTPIPASWLYCFDRAFRFATPKKVYDPNDKTEYPDPFALLGLAEDPAPKPVGREDPYGKRETPQKAWNAFELQSIDSLRLDETSRVVSFIGGNAGSASQLPDRLQSLAIWLGKVAESSIAVRWAAQQLGLHPEAQGQIAWKLRQLDEPKPIIEEAWETLFDVWNGQGESCRRDLYDLASRVKKSGWSHSRLRQYETLGEPKPSISTLSPADALFASDVVENLSDLMAVRAKVPEPEPDFVVTDDWIERLVRVRRKNLERGIEIEQQRGLYGVFGLPPIHASDDPDISSHDRTHGLHGLAFRYLEDFKKLLDFDRKLARREMQCWLPHDKGIFARFRIWSVGVQQLTSKKEAGETLVKLADEVLWGDRHQRDLLHSFKLRWNDLSRTSKCKIEKRLLKGRKPWRRETEEDFQRRRAAATATTLQWMVNNGCELELDFEQVMGELQEATPDWKPSHADQADASLESRGGAVRTNTAYDSLLEIPEAEILAKSAEKMGRGRSFLEEDDPFKGLCDNEPDRALSALKLAGQTKKYPEWAWSRWLNRTTDEWSDEHFSHTAELVCDASDDDLAELKYSVFRWYEKVASVVPSSLHVKRDKVFWRLLDVLKQKPETESSGIVRQPYKTIDWLLEALNSPAGELAEALLKHSEVNKRTGNEAISEQWIEMMQALLNLSGDNRRFASIMLMSQLTWLHHWLPELVDEGIQKLLTSNDPLDHDAYWAGFAYGVRGLPPDELLTILKPKLLDRCASSGNDDGENRRDLLSTVLACWLNRNVETGDRLITNKELSDLLAAISESRRCHALWQIKNWSEEKDAPFNWTDELTEFITQVWPRTRAAKTTEVTKSLFEIVLSDADRLPALAPITKPRLGKIDKEYWSLHDLHGEVPSPLTEHPEIVLDLLHHVLTVNPRNWPYNIIETLDAIERQEPSLAEDFRMIELRRRWANR